MKDKFISIRTDTAFCLTSDQSNNAKKLETCQEFIKRFNLYARFTACYSVLKVIKGKWKLWSIQKQRQKKKKKKKNFKYGENQKKKKKKKKKKKIKQ